MTGPPPEADARAQERAWAEAVWRHGDEAAFRALYRLHAPALYLFALRLTGGRESDAEDVVQETWIRAVRGLRRFQWRSSLRTWLSAILLNCVREWGRDRLHATDAPEPPAPAREPADAIDLERAIARLPGGYRTVLILHDVEGYTHAEIGAMLGVEAGTSKSQLFRARQRLRALLAPGRPHTEMG